MTWRDLSELRGSHPEGSAFRIAIEKRGVRIKPGTALTGKLGWKRGDKIAVMVGEAEHAGLALMVPSPAGWALVTSGGRSKAALALKLPRRLSNKDLFPGSPEMLRSTVVEALVVAHDGPAAIRFRLPWVQASPAIPDAAPAVPMHAADVPAVPVAAAPQPSNQPTKPVEDRAGPPTRRTFPIQQRTLAEVDAPKPTPAAAPKPEPAAFGRMSAAQTEEFIQACARGAMWSELQAIVTKPPGAYSSGSVQHLKDKLADRIDAAKAKRHGLTLPSAQTEQPAAGIPDHILKFVRDEIVPVLAPLDRRVTKNRDDTGLLLDGKPVTLAELVAEVNRLLAIEGDKPIAAPAWPAMAAE